MEKKQYERLTPTDTIALLTEVTQEHNVNDSLKYALRLKELEDIQELTDKYVESANSDEITSCTSCYGISVGDTVFCLQKRKIMKTTVTAIQTHSNYAVYDVSIDGEPDSIYVRHIFKSSGVGKTVFVNSAIPAAYKLYELFRGSYGSTSHHLLFETIDILKENGKTLSDVVWIEDEEGEIDINDFIIKANKTYKIRGNAVEPSLHIVGNDWWLERHESDNYYEWWEFKTYPTRPTTKSSGKNFVYQTK